MRPRSRARAGRAASAPSVAAESLEFLTANIRDELGRVRALSKRTVDLRRELSSLSDRARAAVPPAIRGVLPERPEPLPALLSRRQGGAGGKLRADLVGLRRVAGTNAARADAAIRRNAAAIDELGRAQQRMAAQLDALQATDALALLRRLAGNLATLERRVVAVAEAQSTAIVARDQDLRRAIVRQDRALKAQGRTARIAKLNATAASMQSSAYGAKGSPFATNNLLLAANQLLWNFGGDALRALGFAAPAGASALAWLSPIASLAVGGVVLGDRQHDRFVSGVATDLVALGGDPDPDPEPDPIELIAFAPIARALLKAPDAWTVRVSLQSSIAPALWRDFRRRTDVPATATIVGQDLDAATRASATVREGVLYIVAVGPEVGPKTQVAWLVDTGA